MNALILNKLETLQQKNGMNKSVSLYRAQKPQYILNAPILKPLFVLVLEGEKIVGDSKNSACTAGNFIFFTNVQSINMRNIPNKVRYAALLIEFEFSDFYNLPQEHQFTQRSDYTVGDASESLYKCLIQFIECLEWATAEIIENRRIEIIKLLIALGNNNLSFTHGYKMTTRKVIEILQNCPHQKMTIDSICLEIGMSQSTLYRKLQAEGESLQEIKDKILMGKAIHLLQTTHFSAEYISTLIGYSSYFRFSQKFKSYFGLTLKEFKNTK